jgi:two-component system sensor histidine kinase VicK
MKQVRFFHTVQSKIILMYVLLIIMAMQIIGVYFVKTMEGSFESTFKESLRNRTALLSQYVRQAVADSKEGISPIGSSQENLQAVIDNFNQMSGAEVQIVDTNNIVLTSSVDEQAVGQKMTSLEITQALQGFTTEKKVRDQGVRKLLMVVPIKDYDSIIGAVYILASMEDIYKNIEQITKIFLVGIGFALVLTVVLGVILANTITKPIKEMTKKIKRMGEGKFDQPVTVIGEDEISQLGKAYNDMLVKLNQALSTNEDEKEKLSSILTNLSDGVIATDERGKVILINRRATQMLGMEGESLIGKDIAKLVDFEKNKLHHDIDATDEGKEPSFLVKLTLSPYRRQGENVLGSIIVIQDVTEQERLESLRREFVANVSHELRTPLTSMKSYVEALDYGAIEDVNLRTRFMNVLRNETERMIRLVSDLLQLSRLDSSREVIHKKLQKIGPLLDDLADRFSFQTQQRGIEIDVILDEALLETKVELDADKMDQVLDNVLSNAVKFTPDNGKITIRAILKASEVEVNVSDTGIGIPQQDLPHIFERFYRVDKARTRNQGGTGLGLSISREIIHAHGGKIEIMSVLGTGTTVRFTLPIPNTKGSDVL